MPLAIPKVMMSRVSTMATTCQAVLPQEEAVSVKRALKASTPSRDSTEPVKAPTAYLRSHPTTTE